MAAIETQGLTKTFGDLVAVDDLDLTVESGDVFGFLGPNGAGKSTTINVLLGFLQPTDGTATVLGTDVQADPVAARKRVGVLPEGFSPYDRLSGREHVAYAAGLKDTDVDAAGLLERVGLDSEAWDRRAGTYSTGMRQRLALATALVGDPDLLVLDEPSGGLDPAGMQEMRDLIRAEAESGTTVFFSSHILSEVEAVCDELGILVDGDLATVGDLDALRAGTGTVTLDLTVDPLPNGLTGDVTAIDGVESATTTDSTLAVELDDPARKIDVISRVDDRTTITDVIAESPSLESLFERHVARSRRASDRDRPDRERPDGDPREPAVAATDTGGESA